MQTITKEKAEKERDEARALLVRCWDAAGLLTSKWTKIDDQAWERGDDLVAEISELRGAANRLKEVEAASAQSCSEADDGEPLTWDWISLQFDAWCKIHGNNGLKLELFDEGDGVTHVFEAKLSCSRNKISVSTRGDVRRLIKFVRGDYRELNRLRELNAELRESLRMMLTFEALISTHRPSAVYVTERAKAAIAKAT